jgi:signal transduction histidine kinase
MYVSRGLAWFERGRARALLGVRVSRPYRPDPPGEWWRVQWARFKDPALWREQAYHLVMLPMGVVTFVVTTVLWSLGLSALFLPLYAWAIDDPPVDWIAEHRWYVDTPGEFAVVALIGLVLVLVTPWVIHGLAMASRSLVTGLLGADPAERVQTLTETRAAVVDLAAEDRRKIERDLHDGVQQRLVTLAMDLGRAKEKFETDPETATRLVGEAHEEAKRAITEVRDLARGIYPAVLTDRGLDAALSSLASRSPVPVSVHVDLRRRPPASVEAAAYFLVSEALTNVAKHARASRAQVTVRLTPDDRLSIVVFDDGGGGADPAGAGLAGLRDRVRALDGELRVHSPEGGPTTLSVEIPCAW